MTHQQFNRLTLNASSSSAAVSFNMNRSENEHHRLQQQQPQRHKLLSSANKVIIVNSRQLLLESPPISPPDNTNSSINGNSHNGRAIMVNGTLSNGGKEHQHHQQLSVDSLDLDHDYFCHLPQSVSPAATGMKRTNRGQQVPTTTGENADIVLEYFLDDGDILDVGANVELVAEEEAINSNGNGHYHQSNNSSNYNRRNSKSTPRVPKSYPVNLPPKSAAVVVNRKQAYIRSNRLQAAVPPFGRPLIMSRNNGTSRPKPPPRTDFPEIKMRLHDKQRINKKRPRGQQQQQQNGNITNNRGGRANGGRQNGRKMVTITTSPTPLPPLASADTSPPLITPSSTTSKTLVINSRASTAVKPKVLMVQENGGSKQNGEVSKLQKLSTKHTTVRLTKLKVSPNASSNISNGKTSSISPLIATVMANACYVPAASKNFNSTSTVTTVTGRGRGGAAKTQETLRKLPGRPLRLQQQKNQQSVMQTPVLRIDHNKRKAAETEEEVEKKEVKEEITVEPSKKTKKDELEIEDQKKTTAVTTTVADEHQLTEEENEHANVNQNDENKDEEEEDPEEDQEEEQLFKIPPPTISSKPQQSVASTSNGGSRRVNPFELQNCRQFEENKQPFTIKIKADTMALMDLHAHCLKTEVIGLLGGHYCPITQTVNIRTAEPCPSICNDSIKCEIDPVSQATALEKLEQQHFQVVGWYHSHPTFSPDPSNRDIETQTDYQRMFSDMSPVPGGRPYVAFILSPFMRPDDREVREKFARRPPGTYAAHRPPQQPAYKRFYSGDKKYAYADFGDTACRYFTRPLNALLASPYRCFWVAGVGGNGGARNGELNGTSVQEVPYEMSIDFTRDDRLIPLITSRLGPMCQWIARDFPSSVIRLYRTYVRVGNISVNYLEKVIASLSHILTTVHCSEAEADRIKQECIAILADEFALLATTNERRPSAQ